jgi:hypothetical protein
MTEGCIPNPAAEFTIPKTRHQCVTRSKSPSARFLNQSFEPVTLLGSRESNLALILRNKFLKYMTQQEAYYDEAMASEGQKI